MRISTPRSNIFPFCAPTGKPTRSSRACAAPSSSNMQRRICLRAANLPLLPSDELHVSDDLKRIQKGKPLAPVLLVRGDLASGLPLIVADGYHRICAIVYFDESALGSLPNSRYRGQKRVMDFRPLLGEPTGQGWVQLAELALAFVLSRVDRI